MLSNERWTPVSTHPQYEVSTEGRVRNTKTGLILRPQYNGKGYQHVSLSTHGRVQQRTIHVLVVEAYIGLIPKGLTVNHKDGDKSNNRFDNLEIATYSENMRHAIRTGLASPRGAYKAVRCVETGEVFESVKAAAEHFGVFATEISAVLNGRRTTARGNRFEIVGEDA